MPSIESRYQEVLSQVRAAAPGRSVTLIAVSKTQPVEAIETLYRLGHRDFGENYVQEMVSKAEELRARGCTEIRWHFIGHLQTNKVKALIPHVFAVHSVDSLRLAVELGKRWGATGRAEKLPVFLEVNIDREDSKSGLLPDHVRDTTREVALIQELSLQGLMCIPSPASPGSDTQGAFKRLAKLEEKCRPQTQGALSMGMSDDFEDAIRAGSTHVRVGTKLFGPRKLK